MAVCSDCGGSFAYINAMSTADPPVQGQKLSLGSNFTAGALVSSVGKWLDRGLTAMMGGGDASAGAHKQEELWLQLFAVATPGICWPGQTGVLGSCHSAHLVHSA